MTNKMDVQNNDCKIDFVYEDADTLHNLNFDHTYDRMMYRPPVDWIKESIIIYQQLSRLIQN